MVALNGMSEAMTDYRVAGRLRDEDGNIPSIEQMRRDSMRANFVTATVAKN